jgi:hypothetical protein
MGARGNGTRRTDRRALYTPWQEVVMADKTPKRPPKPKKPKKPKA